MNNSYDVLIIGGGASGMMAAISAAEQGARVLVIEKNKRLGEKLRITGGGRCNIYNAEEDVRTLLGHYGSAEKFLYSAFSVFGVAETKEFFDSIKLPTKVESRNRAFPVSDKAVDVVHAMQNRLHRLGVNIVSGAEVTHFTAENSTIKSLSANNQAYTGNTYILATGGLSRPETGSTGDGFAWLEQIGHTVHTPTPNITPLALDSVWKAVAAGKSLTDCAVSFMYKNKLIHKVRGGVVLTHFGVSGPVILNSASSLDPYLQADVLQVYFDLVPNLTVQELDKQLVQLLNSNGTKLLKNTLPLLLPAGMTPAIAHQLSGRVNMETKSSELPKTARQLLVATIKALPATATGLMGFEKAVIADGGVPLTEIDTRTFRSKKCMNLYVTGDLLHIQRPSGGYSLQLCWTTGYIAGLHAAKQNTK